MIRFFVHHIQVFNVRFFLWCLLLVINAVIGKRLSFFISSLSEVRASWVLHAFLSEVVMESSSVCSCFSMSTLMFSAISSTTWALVICWGVHSWNLDFHMRDHLSMRSTCNAFLIASVMSSMHSYSIIYLVSCLSNVRRSPLVDINITAFQIGVHCKWLSSLFVSN